MAFAERITAHKTPLNSRYWRGFYFLGGNMNKFEALENLKRYESEISKYQSLSRALMSQAEMLMVDSKIIQLKERISNIRIQLYGN